MRKAIILIFSLTLILIILSIFLSDPIFAGRDSPHNRTWTTNTTKQVGCSGCHVARSAPGPSGTQAANPTLCKSCHASGETEAPEKPFADSDQANWATLTGTSHSWSATLPDTSDPNNNFGLRSWTSIQTYHLYANYVKFRGVVCSTCHNQHVQSRMASEPIEPNRNRDPWEPFARPYSSINSSGDSGTATGGSTTQIIDADRGPLWTANMWTNFYVKMTSGPTTINRGAIRPISSNDANSLTVSSAFPASVQNGDRYEIIGRHFQRITNDTNQMCEECHWYRSANWVTSVREYTGNYLSHPVSKSLTTVSYPDQFNPAPLEPVYVFSPAGTIAAQTGIRYRDNGGNDTNFTNNIVLDAENKVRCLSCHRIHYGDSDSTTVDLP